jgi:hypothetical protein
LRGQIACGRRHHAKRSFFGRPAVGDVFLA